MKKALRVLIGLVVLVVLVVVLALIYVDHLVKIGVERGGSHAMGVNTTLGQADLQILRGALMLDNLTVANPEGFAGDHFLHSGRFDLVVDTASVTTDTVRISRFELNRLDMNIARKVDGSNVSVIMDNLKRLQSDKEKEQPSGKKVVIDKVLIKDVSARFHLVTGPPLTVKVPQIELTGVGNDVDGVSMARLMGELLPAILAAVVESGKGVIPPDVLNDLNGQVNEVAQALGGGAKELVSQAHSTVGGAMGAATQAVGGAADAVTGAAEDLQKQTTGAIDNLLGKPKAGQKKD